MYAFLGHIFLLDVRIAVTAVGYNNEFKALVLLFVVYLTTLCFKLCYVKSYDDFISNGATAPSGPGHPHYRGFTITLRHTTLGRTALHE
jgi:hypothetical protein